MRVGTTDTKGGHASSADPHPRGPGCRLAQDPHVALLPVDMPTRNAAVQRPGHETVLEGQEHFENAGGPRGSLSVTCVGFERTDSNRLATISAVGSQYGLRLDRVAQDGAGAVSLNQVNIRAGQPGVGEGGPDDGLLGGAVGGGEPVGGTVLVDGRTADEPDNAVPEPARLGQALKDEHDHTFGPAGAVSRVREGLAPTVRCHAALARELNEQIRGRHDRDPAHERHVALALANRGNSEVGGN